MVGFPRVERTPDGRRLVVSRVIEAGTTGRVQVAGGPWVPFEVDSCEEYRWTWRVAKIPATGHFVDPADRGARVGFEIPLPAAACAVVCRCALQRIADSWSELAVSGTAPVSSARDLY